ncbi:MAG: hypothetical protein M1837_005024 [Sclerophora amabilis]|nr:MAG: hypothetical protein M1837_005024 [Sclerophora amabilis]
MPGILPMKVIKVGSSAQSRVAQACDRCRSKKIRCDGIRPCCSQCANVGFECKTSDKLSRRAFPRGYTESLEERVRSLETEVRELKDLLDGKDDKIDVLSRIHSNSQISHYQMPPPQQPSSSVSSTEKDPISPGRPSSPTTETTVQVQELPFVFSEGDSEPHVVGASTGKPLIDAFKTKAQEKGKSCVNLHSKSFFNHARRINPAPAPAPEILSSNATAPPRLVSDQLVNVFFQEWAPLFPILHQPTFLSSYQKYVTTPQDIRDGHFLVQLYIVFGIAAISSGARSQEEVMSFEGRWRHALGSIEKDSSLPTLQCLALAQLYCISKGDYTELVSYRSLSVGMSHYLGLQQNQSNLSANALSTETRKRVFWTLYTLDCFSAALLGLPKMFKESDIRAEYPFDIDDEYLSMQGFHPSQPGESTKMSGALALFKASRILSKVLDKLYSPTTTSRELCLPEPRALEDELENWSAELPSHLKLQFVQDKPATNIVSSRCPIMATSPILSLAESSKRIIQIVQLLEERRLSFSVCLNKNELLVLAGFGLLYQNLALNQEGKMRKDGQSLLRSVMSILDRDDASCASAFNGAVRTIMSVPRLDNGKSRSNSEGDTGTPSSNPRLSPGRLQAITSRLSLGGSRVGVKQEEEKRRITLPNISLSSFSRSPNESQPNIASARPKSMAMHSDSVTPQYTKFSRSSDFQKPLNLDYLPFDLPPNGGIQQQSTRAEKGVSSEEWERILGNIDNGQANIYDNIYGGPPSSTQEGVPRSSGNQVLEWSPDHWKRVGLLEAQAPPQSVQSYSEDSLTSGEDFSSCELSTHHPGAYHGLSLPEDLGGEGFGLDLLESTFGGG